VEPDRHPVGVGLGGGDEVARQIAHLCSWVGGSGLHLDVCALPVGGPPVGGVRQDGPVSETPEDARHEWTELAEQASAAQFAYHVKDAPTISDGEYDRIIHRLQEIEEAHPSLRTPDSPTQQ